MIEAELVKVFGRAGLAAAAQRARELMLLAEGAVVMLLVHRDRSYVEAAKQAAKRLMRARA